VVRAVFDDWLDVAPREIVPCTHCIGVSRRRAKVPYEFELTTLESALLHHSTLRHDDDDVEHVVDVAKVECRWIEPFVRVPIHELAPDVALT
jgi:hypothetical protein